MIKFVSHSETLDTFLEGLMGNMWAKCGNTIKWKVTIIQVRKSKVIYWLLSCTIMFTCTSLVLVSDT